MTKDEEERQVNDLIKILANKLLRTVKEEEMKTYYFLYFFLNHLYEHVYDGKSFLGSLRYDPNHFPIPIPMTSF